MGLCRPAHTPRRTRNARRPRIDLATRRNDGIDVTLWWTPAEDTVSVEVLHVASDSSFELAVERTRALDAFYHPFAYAAEPQPANCWSIAA